jgi:hypothetical protein
MNTATTNNIGDTVRIRRPARVTTNQKGDTTWMGEVEPGAFELVLEHSSDPYDTAVALSNH